MTTLTDHAIRSHLPWVRHEARAFYLLGGDEDDVLQEALIALLAASRAYDGRTGTFKSFAKLVIRRRLSSAVRNALSQPQRHLNESARDAVLHHVTDERLDVETLVEQRDDIRRLILAAKALKPEQVEALARALNGVPLQGKQDDNQRAAARRKLKAVLA